MSGRTNVKKPLVMSIFILFMLCAIAAGRAIYVDDDGPADFNNIRAAIADANDGDTIIVAEGRYFENINFGGKNIVLRSTNPDNPKVVGNTVIDGGFRGHTVTFAGTETPDCILSGFTITRGRDTTHLDTLGGGIYGNGTKATIQYNFICDNRALAWIMPSSALGGGLYDCDGIIQYNIISGNFAVGQEFLSAGGGLYGCDGIIRNNVITGNWTGKGGGLFECNGKITNCTISNNVGGGLFWCAGSITNCIIWANGDDLYRSTATFSCIEDDDEGNGNTHTHPCFADIGHWEDPCNTPYYPWDDMWINGDYHLKSQAGRWDPKTESWVKDDVTSPCIDAGDLSTPIGLEPFPNGGRINMGAYGGTAEASKSYFGGPVCETIVAGDVNGDCKVNFADFVIMSAHWLERAAPVNCDSVVKDGIEYYIQTGKHVYHLGEDVQMLYRVANLTENPVDVGEILCGGAPHFAITDDDNNDIWQYFRVIPPCGYKMLHLGPYQSKEFRKSWDMTNDNGTLWPHDDYLVTHGRYKITGELELDGGYERVPLSLYILITP